MAWGKNGTPDTLASASDELSIADLTENKFNMLMSHEIYSGVAQGDLNFNNDKAGNDYATRSSKNGAADSTETSANRLIYMADNASGTADFEIGYLFDIASEEKLIIGFFNNQNTAGAGNAPSRREMVGKYDETASRITRIDIDNVGAGDFDTGSNLSALGSEITPAAAIPFAENVQVGSRAEITDTRKMYNFTDSPTFEDDFSSSTGWTTVGSNVTITGGELVASSVDASGDNRIYYPLGFTLEDNFVVRWEHTPKGVSSNSVFLPIMNFTAGTGNLSTSTNQDRVYLFTDSSSQTLYLRGQDGTTAGTNSNSQALTTDTKYYLELVKNGTSGTVYVRTGSHSGTLVNTLTTTIASGITGLTHVQSGAMTGGNAGTGGYLVDNLEIYNGVTSVSSFTPYWKEIGA